MFFRGRVRFRPSGSTHAQGSRYQAARHGGPSRARPTRARGRTWYSPFRGPGHSCTQAPPVVPVAGMSAASGQNPAAGSGIPSARMARPAFPDGHFYSPVVDVRQTLADEHRLWGAVSQPAGLDLDPAGHRRLLTEVFPSLMEGYDYANEGPPDEQLERFYD